jgi:hypothetical protein
MVNALKNVNVHLVLVATVVITRIPIKFVSLILKPNMAALGELVAALTRVKERESNLDIVLAMIPIVTVSGAVGEIGVLGQ